MIFLREMINRNNIIIILLIGLAAYLISLVYFNIFIGNETKSPDIIKEVLIFILGIVAGSIGGDKKIS